ncbi:MAG: ATP cone domain-containing protein [Streptobacillus sp.]
MDNIFIKKRDGREELLDIEKMRKVIRWAIDGIDNVSLSQIEMKSRIQFADKMKSEDIQKILIKTAADLISKDTPNYSIVAARLNMFDLRKRAYGRFEPPRLYSHVASMVKRGKYDKNLLNYYTEEEFDIMDSFIDHNRDMEFHYAAIKQLEGKYLVQNRTNDEIYESPQMAYILISAIFFHRYSKDKRLGLVKEFYDYLSKGVISLPTPIMGGLRTPTRQFSSCVLIECGDTLNSINATASAIVKYVSQRAGIGINAGAIRALGSEIRGGEAFHTGCIPFYKYFQSAVKSCSQGGLRGGAATLYYPIWHYEFPELIVLKNNRGVEDNRVRHMDYGVQISKLFYERLIKGGNITLFSPSEVPDLYKTFFSNSAKFEELYTKYENDPKIRKRVIKAVDIFSSIMQERASTGRIYIQNIDHCNTHSAFNPELAPVRQSNLCVSGDTRILTSEGYKRMDENVGKKFTVWNGEEWSENVEIVKTGENQKILRIVMYQEDNPNLETYIDCTEYHKFYVYNENNKVIEVRAKDLKINSKLERSKPNDYLGSVQWIVDEIIEVKNPEDTYCVTEPKRNKVVFNSVLTGNCAEITLPTKPLNNINDSNGEIALCTLSAINLGKIDKLDDMERPLELIVRALDELLDYQDYPVKAAEVWGLARRSLGIGVINYAYYLAKNGAKYGDEKGLELTHKTFEAFQYYLLKASNKLAKEFGKCKAFDHTTYYQGILPIDTYKKDLDLVCNIPLQYDWESLRKEIKEYGLRNSTLSAIAPTETSSQVSNATNGIEPPRDFISIKASKDGILKQVVPDYENLEDNYQLLWSIKENKPILNSVAVMQKFVDQTISTNTNYDPKNYEGEKVPMKVLLSDLLYAYKMGIKTFYYHNTRDGASDKQEDIEDECTSCKI